MVKKNDKASVGWAYPESFLRTTAEHNRCVLCELGQRGMGGQVSQEGGK